MDLLDLLIVRSLHRIETALAVITQKENQIMSDQNELDQDVAAINAVVTDLATATANIQAEIAALQSANPGLDLTGLTAAVAALQGAQAGVDALETPPAAPAA